MKIKVDNEIESLEVFRRSSFTVAQLRVLVSVVGLFLTFHCYAIRCMTSAGESILFILAYAERVLSDMCHHTMIL